MSQNGQTNFKNLAANAWRSKVSDHFGPLCIKGLKLSTLPTRMFSQRNIHSQQKQD